MNARRIVLIAAMSGSLALAACAHDVIQPIGAPLLDSHFGEAVKKARAMQVIHPEGVNADDRGYSGKAAHKAMERYETSGSSAQPGSSAASDANAKAAR